MWAIVIAGSVQVVLLALLPETHPVLTEHYPPSTKYLLFRGKNPATLQQSSPGRRIATVASQAASMIVSEPIILFISLWQSTVFGIVYMFFSAFPVVFGDIYGFNDYQVGLSFLGILVGLALYILYDYNIGVVLMGKKIKERGPCPEYRAYPAMLSGVCIVVSLFLFAGLARPSVHWIGPIIASALYGFGALGVVLSTFGYLLDSYRPCMPAASAATSVIRSVVTAFCPLYGDVFFRKVGVQNASIILACIAVLELGIPLIAIAYGQRIRAMSARAAK
jgi:DHA1 family multidrug resistance protein-like MFS transporter